MIERPPFYSRAHRRRLFTEARDEHKAVAKAAYAAEDWDRYRVSSAMWDVLDSALRGHLSPRMAVLQQAVRSPGAMCPKLIRGHIAFVRRPIDPGYWHDRGVAPSLASDREGVRRAA